MYILLAVLLQIAGPFLFGFDKWCNVIQYTSGFAMIYAAWHYFRVHRKSIAQLHEKLDELIGSEEDAG